MAGHKRRWPAPQPRASAIRFIGCLGLVSVFADMTYEGARSVIGPFLKDLGASAALVGFIAGFGGMLASGLRLFSGRLADRTRVYWTITALGYTLTLVAVPLLAFAGNWQLAALLVFGVAAQLAAAAMFFGLRKPLAARISGATM